MPKIKIIIDGQTILAELYDTDCAMKIYNNLPIQSQINEWGDEFYFSIGLKMPLDSTATTSVKAGDIGYWPPGEALAVFFGKTPLSKGDDPVAASEVNIVGRLLDDPSILKKLKGSKHIKIEKE
ncbi:cyclophilin-like fold protein [Thermodesulfovibrio sp.]|uniref:cyclophilin-like fold protein n=1 Tax=Thermodesulfovibrio sp. TaxID=2067987 RepID=UPI0030A1A607